MVCQAMIDRYCQEVAIAVKSSGVQDPALLKQLRCDLEEFLEEHPNAAEPELRKRFGQPESYATEYFAAMDAGRQRKVLADKKFRRKVLVTTVAAILAALIAALLIWAAGVTAAVEDFYSSNRGHWVTAPKEVYEESMTC